MSQSARAMLDALNDGRLRIIDRSSKRLSSADHFSACVRDASGEYMMILSDDDLIEPGYVSGMYDAIHSNSRTIAVLGEQVVIGEHDSPVLPASAEATIQSVDGIKFFFNRLVRPRWQPIITYVSVFARRSDLLRFPYRNYPDGSNSDNFMMLSLALHGGVTISSRRLYYRVYESSSGLRATFTDLMKSCAMFEHDAMGLLSAADSGVGVGRRLALRTLLRVRNCSMMGRRLFTLYRRRMGIQEFIAANGRLVGYFCGVTPHSALK
jgi:hypothetical protein